MVNLVWLYVKCYCYIKNLLYKCGIYFVKFIVNVLYNKYGKYELVYFFEVWNIIFNFCLLLYFMSGWLWN